MKKSALSLLAGLGLACAAAAQVASPNPAASTPAAAAPAAAAPSPAARPAPLPGALPAFAEVTREAKRAEGLLPVWTRDDKTWLEIPTRLLEVPLYFASATAAGLGEQFFLPGLMGRPHIVVLRRVGNNLQLLARNEGVRAPAGTPLARAVAESYSDSLLASAPLVAAPLAQALLVDALALLGGDLSGRQTALETAFRLPYALDRANSHIERVRNLPSSLHLTMRQHFSLARLPAPPAVPSPAPGPNLPTAVPDARSLFLSQTYTLAQLPAQPMKTRAADPRVGYFMQSYQDFGDDTQLGRHSHILHRWRLEKKDPSAAFSEPKEPIRVVLDRNIPERWRAPLREAALEWNTAFEKAGFRNAITVEQQADDAEGTTLEAARVLAVRWFAQQGAGSVAIGPHQSDPRTGEILRGAALIDENRVRVFRTRAAEGVPRWADHAQPRTPLSFAQPFAECTFADDYMDEARFGFDLLGERGLLDPLSPEADRYIADALKNVAMHEIGHALGLRHNFRASASVTPAQLRDRRFTSVNGLSSSVMDYHAQNLPLMGEPVADYNMLVLGAYDHWAIEYGYREFTDAEAEKQGLQALAARGDSEPNLAYATDDDLANNDPLITQRDMSNDPLDFARRQIALSRELWQRITTRALAPDEDLNLYRRAMNRVLASLATSLPMATKYVGGVYTSRARAGANQALVVPVPAAQQRAALDLVVAELFNANSFKFDPALMSRLGQDLLERDGVNRGGPVDFSLPGAVLGLQRGALDSLMSDSLAARLADAESKVTDTAQLMSYAEVQQRLSKSVWAELSGSAGKGNDKALDIVSLRRNLQREHLRRLAAGLLRAAPAAAADVHAVHRQAALQLQAQLAAAVASKRGSDTVRAHLQDSLATLGEALKAPLVKQGV